MRGLRALWLRLRGIFGSGRAEAEFSAELQSHLATQGDRTPVIFITAFPEERVRRQAIAAGAIGFLAKPFDGDAMSACIERALKASGLSASS